MIKISEKEKDGTAQSSLTQKIHVTLENKEEKTFESYPIVIKSKDIKHLIYEIQKSTSIKNNTAHSGGFIDKVIEKAKEVKDAVVGSAKDVAGKAKDSDRPALSSQSSESFMDKVKEKAKDAKDAVVDTTKGAAEKTKDTVSPSSSSSSQSSGSSTGQDRRYEEGGPGTDVQRGDDPLTEYREKEAMTPAKIKEHEPTAVKRDPSDQKITQPGQTGTDDEKAREQLRRSGMTKIDTGSGSDTAASDTGSGSETVVTETTTTETKVEPS